MTTFRELGENEKLLPSDELFLDDTEKYLREIEKEFKLAIDKWDVIEWKAVVSALISKYQEQEFLLSVFDDMGKEFFDEIKHRRQQNKDRIFNRKDQVDKRAFQEAVRIGMEDYATKAAAIKDLNVKPQFSEYSNEILRGWLKLIWNKPIKVGRPKK